MNFCAIRSTNSKQRFVVSRDGFVNFMSSEKTPEYCNNDSCEIIPSRLQVGIVLAISITYFITASKS